MRLARCDVGGVQWAGRCGLIALLVAGPAQVAAQSAAASSATPASVIPPLASLPAAHVEFDAAQQRLTVELPPADLPGAGAGMEGMVSSPVYQAVIPASCSVYGARASICDASGQALPQTFLHHVELADPDLRDLFLPIALHVLGLSKETPPLAVPRLLVGLPLTQGERLITWSMLHNPTTTSYTGARVRVEFSCRPAGTGVLGSVFPLFRAYPWAFDVLFPVGKRAYSLKSFDLPPGRISKSTEGSPSIPGTIVGMGGHVHDYAVGIEFRDATTNELLWQVAPRRDSAGHVLELPITTFYNWHSLGLHITPEHRYRVTVTYDNPTGRAIPEGGMGTVAGLFIPDRGVAWPHVDRTNDAYVQEMMETLGIGAPPDMGGMQMPAH